MRRFLITGSVVAVMAGTTLVASVIGQQSIARAAIAPTASMYLSVSGIPGEVTTSPYTNQSQAASFTWSVTGSLLTAPVLSNLVVTLPEDRSVPALEIATAKGTTVPSVVLTEVGTFGSGPAQVLTTITLTNAVADKVSLTGSADANTQNNVVVSFHYAKEKTVYNTYSSTGVFQAAYTSCWNIAANAPTC
jgi:type VI protein secretion system component Hcp